MNLDEALYDAINTRNGFEMIVLLKDACAAGMPRKNAEQALQKLCERLSREGREAGEDLATELLMITQNFCQEQHRIWPLD